MNYVIAQCPDIEAFYLDIRIFQTKNAPFTSDYISSFTEEGIKSGWGCIRFEYPVPDSKIFHAPCVEYRFSHETGKWQVNGEDSKISPFIDGLHQYFVSLEGKSK